MSLSQRAFIIASAVSLVCLAATSAAVRAWPLLAVPATTAFLWFVPGLGSRARPAALAVVVCGGAAGVLAGFPPLLALGAVAAGLAAWDLGALSQRVSGVADPEAARRVERAHLQRLLLTIGAGCVLGVVTFALRVRLAFAPLLGLGVLLAAGLGVFLRSLRRSSDR